MRIVSADRRSWLSVDRLSDGHGYSSWALEASVQTAHGDTFHGRNGDVHLLVIDRFIADLDAFVLHRQIPAKVDGTYDSFVRFSGGASGVTLEFRIGAASHASKVYAISGAFPIEQEALLELVAAFKEEASIDA